MSRRNIMGCVPELPEVFELEAFSTIRGARLKVLIALGFSCTT